MKPKQDRIELFLGGLRRLRFKDAFNPYADICDLYDKPTGAELRRQNLRNVLRAAVENGVGSIWIARDLGYRGGRRTGLALTDEAHLASHSKLLNSAPLRRATRGPMIAERTASIIWSMLASINEPVFLWNVFPLHPHDPHEPLSNRTHNRAERAACQPFLFWLLRELNPKRVVAIGRDAKGALDDMGVEALAVRHPSYGGQNDFIQKTGTIYGLSSRQSASAAQLPMI